MKTDSLIGLTGILRLFIDLFKNRYKGKKIDLSRKILLSNKPSGGALRHTEQSHDTLCSLKDGQPCWTLNQGLANIL